MFGKNKFVNIFHVVCLIITFSLACYCVYLYKTKEPMNLVDYKLFNERLDEIYPSLSLCFYHEGFIKEKFLKKTDIFVKGKPIQVSNYIDYLRGNVWNPDLVDVDYDNVTLQLEDHLKSLKLKTTATTKNNFYKWPKKGGKKAAPSPFYVSYRAAAGKCYTIDLTIDTFPRIKINDTEFSTLTVKLNNFDKKSDKKTGLGIFIHYPKQKIRTKHVKEIEDLTKIRGEKKVQISIDNIDVKKRIWKLWDTCNSDWRNDDDYILHHRISKVGCRPSYLKINSWAPICSKKEQMKGFMPSIRTPDKKLLNETTPPCFEIQTMNQNVIEDPAAKKKGKKGKKSDNEFKLEIEFKNQQYKELRWVHPFDLVALISNVGIYLGLFVGFLLQWQGAEFFIAVLATIRGLFSRRPKIVEEVKEIDEDLMKKGEVDELEAESSETEDKMEDNEGLDIKNVHFLKLDGEDPVDVKDNNVEEEKEKTE